MVETKCIQATRPRRRNEEVNKDGQAFTTDIMPSTTVEPALKEQNTVTNEDELVTTMTWEDMDF